jgi:hypothetical protein
VRPRSENHGAVLLIGALCAWGCSSSSAPAPAEGGVDSRKSDSGHDSNGVIDTAMPRRDTSPYAYNDAAPPCQPSSAAGFEPVKVAPVKNPVCTAGQVAGVVTQCFDPFTGTTAACSAWTSVAANKACMDGCPITSKFAGGPALANPPPPPKGPWGPLVEVLSEGSMVFLNLGGCVAAADSSAAAQSCADALNTQLECEYYTCAGNCPVSADAGASQTDQNAFQNCMMAADSGPCATYATAGNACVAALPAGGPAEFCLDGSLLSGDSVTFDPAFEKLVGDQCGGKPAPEGGTEAGDASGTDAATKG